MKHGVIPQWEGEYITVFGIQLIRVDRLANHNVVFYYGGEVFTPLGGEKEGEGFGGECCHEGGVGGEEEG